jgi:hypothetical protein
LWAKYIALFLIENNVQYIIIIIIAIYYTVMVKESRNRPGEAQRVPGGLGSHISSRSAHEGGEIVSLTHRPPFLPGNVPVLIFTRG